MKQIKVVLVVILLFIYNSFLLTDSVSIELESKPYFFRVYDEHIYVSEISKINIYNLKNYKLIYSVGRKGQGPGEFPDVPLPQIIDNQLVISSDRKLLFFKKGGGFIKESKLSTRGSSLKIFYGKEKYFGMEIRNTPKRFEVIYNIYNKFFIKERNVYSYEWIIKKNKKKDLYEVFFYDAINKDIIFAHADEFVLDIIDSNGKLKKRIMHNSNKIRFTKKDKQRIIQFWKNDSRYRKIYKKLEEKTIFPKYFPYIAACRVNNNKIYVLTYLKKKGKSECLTFSPEGSLLNKAFIDLKITSPFFYEMYFDIYNDKLFQLVDNIEKEKWELLISNITIKKKGE